MAINPAASAAAPAPSHHRARLQSRKTPTKMTHHTNACQPPTATISPSASARPACVRELVSPADARCRNRNTHGIAK